MQQQLTDRRIAITDEAVTPGFRPMLPRFELPRIELQCFDGLDNRRGVAAPEQLGDVLQLPFAGGVRADVARFVDRSAQVLFERHPRKPRVAHGDQVAGQRLQLQCVAATLTLTEGLVGFSKIFLDFWHSLEQDSQ